MPQVAKSVLVPYSAAAMFKLVDDVERYPEFLPWCGGARVLERTDTLTIAVIDIHYAGVRQTFSTANTKEGVEWMRLQLREGPFKELGGHWHFQALNEGASKVELMLDYAFSSAILEAAVGPVFGMIGDTMIDRFVTRADTVYGTGR
jgi:ribosome-associated toxin RatA of RatAB toxin-antitoxin module